MAEKQSSYICRSCLYGCWQKFKETGFIPTIWFHCALLGEKNNPIIDSGEIPEVQCFFYYHKAKK